MARAAVVQSSQESGTNGWEQLVGTTTELLRLAKENEARLSRLEGTNRGKSMKVMKGTRLADLAFEANIRFMEIFVSEPGRCLQNMDRAHLEAFISVWPQYVEAVGKADIAGKWIAAREKQGGHRDDALPTEPLHPEAAIQGVTS